MLCAAGSGHDDQSAKAFADQLARNLWSVRKPVSVSESVRHGSPDYRSAIHDANLASFDWLGVLDDLSEQPADRRETPLAVCWLTVSRFMTIVT